MTVSGFRFRRIQKTYLTLCQI